MTINEFQWPENPDERTVLPLFVSLNEWVAIASSVDVGADIAYPEQWVEVFWVLIRNTRYSMSICSLIIDCILNDADVQQALSDFITNHPGGTTNPKETELPPSVTGGNMLSPNPDCDPDIVWGQMVGIVQTVDRMITDFLETWETYTNSGEIIGAVVSAIPVISVLAETIGVDGIIDYANAIVDAIKENYEADYTLEYEQQLACELFCVAKYSCSLSIDQFQTVMNNRIGNALNLDNMVELMVSLIDADISGFNVADLYFAAFVNMLKVANLVLPITWGIEAFFKTIAVFDTPSNDWEVLCLECPEPNILLEAYAGFPAYTVQYDHTEGIYDYYRWYAVSNPDNYPKGGVHSVGDVYFYVHEATVIGGTFSGTIQTLTHSYASPSDIPCNEGTSNLVMILTPPDLVLMLKVATTPCATPTVWLRARDDGDWDNETTFTFIGNTGDGDSIYEISSNRTSGPNGYGVDTVNEAGDTLQSAYLVSALVDGVPVYSHYYEQADNIGEGDGASGSISSKKWAFYLTGGYGQTIVATFSPTPY